MKKTEILKEKISSVSYKLPDITPFLENFFSKSPHLSLIPYP